MSEEKAASYVPQIKAAYGALLASHKKSLAHALTLGGLLNDAKAALGKKGKWTEWLTEYCPQISHRTANVYMKLAKHKDKFTDEINSQRAAIKALDGDFGVGGAIGIVNAEDEKKDEEPSKDEETEETDDEAEDDGDDETLKHALLSESLTTIFKNVAPDEVFIALRDVWEREQLVDLVNRLTAHLTLLDAPANIPRRAPSAPSVQPS